MIKPKLKRCSVCGQPSLLWRSNPPTCKVCAIKEKVAAKPLKCAIKEIKKVSTRQQKLNAIYNVQATLYKKNNPICKARIQCIGSSVDDIHHKRGRGEYLLDESTWLPVCRSCHRWIENNPEQAKSLGFSENRLSTKK